MRVLRVILFLSAGSGVVARLHFSPWRRARFVRLVFCFLLQPFSKNSSTQTVTGPKLHQIGPCRVDEAGLEHLRKSCGAESLRKWLYLCILHPETSILHTWP